MAHSGSSNCSQKDPVSLLRTPRQAAMPSWAPLKYTIVFECFHCKCLLSLLIWLTVLLMSLRVFGWLFILGCNLISLYVMLIYAVLWNTGFWLVGHSILRSNTKLSIWRLSLTTIHSKCADFMSLVAWWCHLAHLNWKLYFMSIYLQRK